MSSLQIIPLGGVGEFGMNCTALRYGSEMILIDAGLTFPGGNLSGLGIDLIVPEIEFLLENRDQLKAIFLTHGHEDHLGAVPFVVGDIPVPVYGGPLTLGLAAHRLKERGLAAETELLPIEARQTIEVGPFRIEPIRLTHSFPENFAFAITTPVGTIIWTGDFKFDQTPVDRRPSDVGRLAEYGEAGVLALFSDSTNSDTPGLSPSEFSVLDPLRTLFRKAQGKIILSCFASSIHRVQLTLDLAREFERKVVLLGRSMQTNVRIAEELGYLKAPAGIFVPSGRELPDDQMLVLATGSQGEPMSAMSRLALNEVKDVKVEDGDLVILSARIIPGNEKLISNMVNHFYRRGAHVHDPRFRGIHASGHGFREDLKLMINLTRPRFFIPIHGEYRQLRNHSALAADQGIPVENILVIENGDILELSETEAQVAGNVPVGRRFIDEGHRAEVDELVVRDRRYLSEDGFLVVVMRIDRFSGELIGEPELVSRGFVMMESSAELVEATRNEIYSVVSETPAEEKRDEDVFKEILRKQLKRFLRKQTGKRPMIIPVMLEI